ncbi:MAG: hypothetical protein PHG97_02605 [Candidatus Margulisbacteria bacterium]|nr:hypothetical protein [Candidatus Margulisiibacteriota bacterium]
MKSLKAIVLVVLLWPTLIGLVFADSGLNDISATMPDSLAEIYSDYSDQIENNRFDFDIKGSKYNIHYDVKDRAWELKNRGYTVLDPTFKIENGTQYMVVMKWAP